MNPPGNEGGICIPMGAGGNMKGKEPGGIPCMGKGGGGIGMPIGIIGSFGMLDLEACDDYGSDINII